MTPCEAAARYRSKIVARRWLSTIADLIGLLIICGAIGALLGDRRGLLTNVLLTAVVFGYYVVFETLFGRTLGKFITGLIVVNEQGSVPNLWQVVVRTATRLVEVNPVLLGGIPAGIIADQSRCRQRWGDMLAHTYVIFVKDLPSVTWIRC